MSADSELLREVLRQPEMQGIQGVCPMGCGHTLFLGADGFVTCSWMACPDPVAASDLLAAPFPSARISETLKWIRENRTRD